MRSLILLLLAIVAWAAPTDAVIEQQIRAKLAKSKISANGNKFTVTVKNGVATLDGSTNVIQHKGTATRIAKAGGARQVENRIKVSEEAKRKASADLAEGRKKAATKKTATPASTKSAAPALTTASTSATAPAAPPLRRAQVVQR